MANAPSEAQHDEVYGKTFALYDKKEILEFIKPFEQRFSANGIDPRATFTGKHCMDAGCGGGRGSIFMLMNGAKTVEAFDFSERNVETTRRNAAAFGFAAQTTVRRGTLAELPYADGTFDFVWCNGVLQHAADPDACLKEITRVLKVGGQAWIYVYGAGGVYWYAVRRFRALFRDISTNACIAALRLLRCDTRYVAEYIDDWKVDFLRTYTAADLSGRMAQLGYQNPTPLKFGTSYDTSHRINTYPNDAVWLGDGDLRYLTVKTDGRAPGNTPLEIGEYGSTAAFAPEVLARFKAPFDELERAVAGKRMLAVAAAANLQRALRDQMTATGAFDPAAFETSIRGALELVAAWNAG